MRNDRRHVDCRAARPTLADMSRVAFVISTVGYHWEELFGAWDELTAAGVDVELYTVNGRAPRADAKSLRRTGPLSLLGLGVRAAIAPESERGRLLEQRLA